MTKKDLIATLTSKVKNLTEKDIGNAVNVILEQMSSALHVGERIEIRGFGSFNLHHWGPRYARNPVTGETWRTEPVHTVHFKPGKLLKNKVNNGLAVPIIDVEEEEAVT